MKKYILYLACLASLFFGIANAQTVSVKGMGTVSYSGFLGSGDKSKAYQKAQISAVERYFADRGQADYESFDSNRDKIVDNLDDFITGTTVLGEQEQSGLNKYSVTVKVDINETKLNVLMRKSSVASKAPAGSKSKIAFIFVGREAASVRSFDARVSQRTEVSTTSSKSSGSFDGVNERSSNAAVKVETGGSTLRKADDATYRVYPLADQRSAITSVFSQAGYKVVDSDLVLGDKEIKAITRDYSSGSDLQPSTIRSIYAALRAQGVPIFVIATLNLDAPITDPSSGMQRESVRISARALDVSDGSEIASVPPVLQFGLGATNQDAANAALKNGALAGAREVVSRLNAVGAK